MKEAMKVGKENVNQVIKIQSWARGQKVRKQVAQHLAMVEEQQQQYFQDHGNTEFIGQG